MPTLINTTTSL